MRRALRGPRPSGWGRRPLRALRPTTSNGERPIARRSRTSDVAARPTNLAPRVLLEGRSDFAQDALDVAAQDEQDADDDDGDERQDQGVLGKTLSFLALEREASHDGLRSMMPRASEKYPGVVRCLSDSNRPGGSRIVIWPIWCFLATAISTPDHGHNSHHH